MDFKIIPAWHPRQPLSAADFLRWEEYLLLRSSFQGDEPGIERMAVDSVCSAGSKFRVKNLSGLTSLGQPVVITDDQELFTEAGDGTHDLFIEVHAASWGAAEAEPAPVPVKFSLVAVNAPEGGSLPAIADWRRHLYLGRWRKGGVECQLLALPRPRRLVACLPLLPLQNLTWAAWLAGFIGRISGGKDLVLKQCLESSAHKLLLSELFAKCQALASPEADTLTHPSSAAAPVYPSCSAARLPAFLEELVKSIQPLEHGLVDPEYYTITPKDPGCWRLEFLKKSFPHPARVVLKSTHMPSIIYVGKGPRGLIHSGVDQGNGSWELTSEPDLNPFELAWSVRASSGDNKPNIRIYHA